MESCKDKINKILREPYLQIDIKDRERHIKMFEEKTEQKPLYTIDYDDYYDIFIIARYPSLKAIAGYVTSDRAAVENIVELLNRSHKSVD